VSIVIDRNPIDRKAYRLVAEQCLPVLRDEVFRFFSDATQLENITPRWLKFSVLTPSPIPMHTGALIDYRIWLRGIPIRWRTKITKWEPPDRFADEQVSGPYRFWRHEHTFHKIGGNTLVRDRVNYSVPGGAWVHSCLVKSDLHRIFAFRHRTLAEIFRPSFDTASPA